MVAGLVAMDVSSQKALCGYIFVVGVAIFREVASEKLIEVGDEFPVSSHHLHEPFHVVRHVE